MRKTPLLAVALGALALPTTADARLKEHRYDVTFEVTMTERWQAATKVDKECFVNDVEGRCTEDASGSGTARLLLRTPTPQRVSVMTGPGMKPTITHSIDSGIPLKGEYKRTGSFTDTYAGLWDEANPDQAMSTRDCGAHQMKRDVSLGWKGRNQLQPILLLDEPLECPSGPYEGFRYEGDPPALSDVVAQVSESKFRGVKQFRFGGSRTWRGFVEPVTRTDPQDLYSRSGESETTWTWEATFRKAAKKKKRKR